MWSNALLYFIGFLIFVFAMWKSYVPYFPVPYQSTTPLDSNGFPEGWAKGPNAGPDHITL